MNDVLCHMHIKTFKVQKNVRTDVASIFYNQHMICNICCKKYFSEPNFVSTKPKGIPDPPWTSMEFKILINYEIQKKQINDHIEPIL